jgi:hypothetical protein
LFCLEQRARTSRDRRRLPLKGAQSCAKFPMPIRAKSCSKSI